MGEKIGRPLTEEVGKPRVLPEAVPIPMPEKSPVPAKRDPITVPVLPGGTEALLRFRAERAKNGTIVALASMLQIPEDEVRETMKGMVSRLSEMYHKAAELGKSKTKEEAGIPHDPDNCEDCGRTG